MDIGSNSTKVDFGIHEAAMQTYFREGEQRAHALENRGPIRFKHDGTLDAKILESYSRCGFYIFEGVLDSEELADIETDILNIQDNLPTNSESKTDSKGHAELTLEMAGIK